MKIGTWLPAVIVGLVAAAAVMTETWLYVPIAAAAVVFAACAIAYPRAALLVWVLVAPIATEYGRLSLPGGVPDITFSRATIVLVAVALLLRVRLQRLALVPLGRLELTMGVLLFVLGTDLAIRSSNVPSDALLRFDERITPLLLFVFARNLFTGAAHMRRILAALAIVGATLGAHGTYQYLFTAGVPSITDAPATEARREGGVRTNESHLREGRAVGPFGSAVEFGAVAAIAFGAMLVLTLETPSWVRIVPAVMMAASAVAVVVSLTRSVWVGVALAVVALAWVIPRKRILILSGSAALALSLLGGYLLLGADSPLKERTVSTEPVSARLLMYRVGLEIAAERPLLGYGSGAPSRQAARRRVVASGADAQYAPGEFHNVFLMTLVEWGVLGLASYTFILVLFTQGALTLWRRTSGVQGDARVFASVFLFATVVYVVQGLLVDTPPFLYLNGLYFFLAGVVFAQLDVSETASAPAAETVGSHLSPAHERVQVVL